MNPKLPPGTLDRLWSDSSNWRGGIVYVCKDDPRVIVPKKRKWGGWTMNFAHGSSWWILFACVLSIIVPGACLLVAGRIGPAIGCAVAIVVFWCVLSVVLSSTKRYENAE
jgi:hypothetical protein